jgi:hypothetical protein
MADTPRPPALEYAGQLPNARRSDAAFGAVGYGIALLAAAGFTRHGLHDEVNPLTTGAWFLLGVTATWFVVAAWRERKLPKARVRTGHVGAVLTGLGWILGCVVIFGPPNDPHNWDIRQQNRCVNNLQQIAMVLDLYVMNNGGRFPDRPEALLAEGLEPSALVCPSSDDEPATGATPADVADAVASGGHLSYIYVGKV